MAVSDARGKVLSNGMTSTTDEIGHIRLGHKSDSHGVSYGYILLGSGN